MERTDTERVEEMFQAMADKGYATSTIDHTWGYLNQACLYAVRRKLIATNPARDVLLPEARPPKERKSLSVDQLRQLLDALAEDERPAQWVTAIMCGLRPGELAGLCWPNVRIDNDDPHVIVTERVCVICAVRGPYHQMAVAQIIATDGAFTVAADTGAFVLR